MNTELINSESSEFYSLEDFEKTEKIDMHLHINTSKLFVVEQAQKDNFKVLTINVDYPAFPPGEEQLEIAVSQKKDYPGIVAYATTFYMEGWDEPDWKEKTIEYIERKIVGGSCAVKVWKNIGMDFRDKSGNMVMIDDPKFDPIFRFVKSQNVPLIGHLGEPKDCWQPTDKMIVDYARNYFLEHPEYHMYKHPELPSYEDQITARDNMLEKNKDIVFVGAHFASLEWSVDKISEFLDRFPSAVIDSAARIGEIQYQTKNDRKKVRDFFIKYWDRIMYATDTFQEPGMEKNLFKKELHDKWLSDWRFLTTDSVMRIDDINSNVKGLQLPRTVVDKIYKKNAERIFPNAWE